MKKILVVDDDRFLANAYRLKLGNSGFEIQIAFDGEEALAALEHFQPDMIVLDLLMPKKDGFETLQALKNDSRFQKIPVLIASDLAQKEDIDRGLKLGAVDYIVKSDLSMKDLIGKINTILAAV